eukprot:9002603-Pyramimonas_sp.AAC.1
MGMARGTLERRQRLGGPWPRRGTEGANSPSARLRGRETVSFPLLVHGHSAMIAVARSWPAAPSSGSGEV